MQLLANEADISGQRIPPACSLIEPFARYYTPLRNPQSLLGKLSVRSPRTKDHATVYEKNSSQCAIPKTFLDAIDVAKSLNIKDIWIDSLCIIQDDSNDWEYESSLMSSVYGRSAINIAAAGAEDGTVECFIEDFSPRCYVKLSSFGHDNLYECVPRDIHGIEMVEMPLTAVRLTSKWSGNQLLIRISFSEDGLCKNVSFQHALCTLRRLEYTGSATS